MKFMPLCLALLVAGVQAQTAPSAPPAPVAPVAPPAPMAPPMPPAPPVAPTPPLPFPQPGRLYTPGAFEKIELGGASRVVLMQGDRDQVFIDGDGDVQSGVSVEVRGDRQLVIRPVSGWKFWNNSRLNIQIQARQVRQLNVAGASDVHAPGLITTETLRLSIAGAGNVRFDQLQARELTFQIAGAGDAQLAGNVEELSLNISGKGKVIADQLKCERARVNISGLGNTTLWVTSDLHAHVSGVGSVDYYGQPQVQRSVAGLGSINAKGNKK